MDISSIIGIIIAAFVIYLVIKFIVSPIIKAVLGIIAFIVIAYFSQRLFGFDIDQIFAPFGISFDQANFDWILNPISQFINRIKSILNL